MIYPKQDMLVKEKDLLTKNHQTKNDHEKDALASAIYGYNEIKPLLKKINKNLKEFLIDFPKLKKHPHL